MTTELGIKQTENLWYYMGHNITLSYCLITEEGMSGSIVLSLCLDGHGSNQKYDLLNCLSQKPKN